MDRGIHLLSHTSHSLRCYKQGLGEMANVETLTAHFDALGVACEGVLDLCHLFGIGEKERKHFFRIVRDPVEPSPPRCDNDHTRRFHTRLNQALGEKVLGTLFVLTFRPILDCVVATGLLSQCASITRVHPLDEEANIAAELYADVDLLVTQTLLGTKLAIAQGIPPWKVLYVPYQTPLGLQTIGPLNPRFRRDYLHGVAARMGKRIEVTDETVVVGCPTRFDFRKNVEYVVQGFSEIQSEVPHALLLLKGSFDRIGDISMGKGYTEGLVQMMQRYGEEPWFLWDPERQSSHSDALRVLQTFDLGVNLCGTPDPLNSTIELLFLGKPVMLLEGGGPHVAMKGAAQFVKNRGYCQMRLGSHPFFIPNMADLQDKLVQLISSEQMRNHLGASGQCVAKQRFGLDLAARRIRLMLEAAHHYYHKTDTSLYQDLVLEALREDERRFECKVL